MIGPYDLSGSMGIPGNLNSPQVLRAERYIVNLCKKKLAVAHNYLLLIKK